MDRVRPAGIFLLRLFCLMLACAATARLGTTITAAHSTLAPMWISAGLAMGAFALWGLWLWPALALGAFWANAASGLPLGTAAGIAIGHTLGAVLGARLLQHWRLLGGLRKPADAVMMMAATALASLLASIIGVLCLSDASLSPWHAFFGTCVVRWLGHFVGAIVAVPLFLAWAGERNGDATPVRKGEAAALLALVVAATVLAFSSDSVWAWLGMRHMSPSLFVVPGLVWAALRLRPKEALLALAAMSGLAVLFTANGFGPFTHDRRVDDLLELQLMLAAVGGTLLILIAAVAERDNVACQLAAAKRTADEANLAKSRFVAAIRHDMGQPLQAAQLFLSVLRGQVPENKARTLIDPTAGSLHAMAAALAALRDITSVECGLIHPEVAEFPLTELLNQLAEEFRIQAVQRGLRFQFAPGPGSVTVATDRHLLGRILRNILVNALRYTSDGGVLLGCRRDRRGLRIEIWDTGPGIPPREQEVIFEAFHRGSSATHGAMSDSESGLGLGLATVRQLASLLGLGVSVRSVVGKGSVFSVLVPMPQARLGNRNAA